MKYSKIKSIKKIGIGKVYDLEVPKHHNFYLANGVLSHNSVDLDTAANVNYVFATQVLEDIPENILKQCKYIFIPATADVNTIKTILVQTALVKNIQVAPNRAMKLKQMMKKVKFSWIVLNRMDGTMDLIKILPPLSSHLETTR